MSGKSHTHRNYADVMRCLRERGPMTGHQLAAALDVPHEWARAALVYLSHDLVRHGTSMSRHGGRPEGIWGVKPIPSGAEVRRERDDTLRRLRHHIDSASLADLRRLLEFIERGEA